MAKVTPLMSGAGWIGSFASKLTQALRKKGVPDEQIHLLVKDGEASDSLIEQIVNVLIATMLKIKHVVFRAELNYDEALEAKTATGFALVNPNLTDKNFKKVVGTGQVKGEAIFVNFGEYIATDEEVVKGLDALGLRPGVPKELADVSKAHPDSQKLAACLPAAALGDSWRDPNGSRHAVYLVGDASLRRLRLLCGGAWDSHWWFLAFRK